MKMSEKIKAIDGMLYYMIDKIRPELAGRVAKKNKLETMIIGLGGQGSKHAGLMNDFGTEVAAAVAPEKVAAVCMNPFRFTILLKRPIKNIPISWHAASGVIMPRPGMRQ